MAVPSTVVVGDYGKRLGAVSANLERERMKYIVLALVACLFAGHADAQTLDAASQGAEIQKMFREKKLKHCSRVFMDGGVWEVISANNDSARIMNGVSNPNPRPQRH